MATETKFERGEPVLVLGMDGSRKVRLFSHMSNGRPAVVDFGNEVDFFEGKMVPVTVWEHTEKLPKPLPFSKGELVVAKPASFEPENHICFFIPKNTVTTCCDINYGREAATNIRRPTIEELRNWIPWCEIKPKQGENQ